MKVVVGFAVVAVLLALGGNGGGSSSPSATVAPAASLAAASEDPASPPAPEPTVETTPDPTPQPTPEPTPGPAFDDIKLSGSGSKVPRFSIPEGVAAIATITNSGSSNFAVWSLAADGSNNDLLVNTIGSYSGTVLFDAIQGEHSVAFKVESSGQWTITIKPVTGAKVWATVEALSGTGDQVVQLDSAVSGFATTSIANKGSGNFAVWSYSASGRDLLVNEIGNYSGEVQLPDGTLLLVITSEGSWAFTAPQ